MSFKTSLSLCLFLMAFLACENRGSQKDNEPAPASSGQAEAGTGGTSGSSDGTGGQGKPGAKAAAKIISALPDKKLVDPIVNARKLPPYSGPTGSVKGIVRATGDQAPELPEVVAKMEAKCDVSRGMFGVLFREGEKRELADVLVAVTHYDGYVPAKGVDVEVWGKGCAWDSRTVAITYGQRLKIDGVDNRPYVPEILGQPMPAQLFVLPTAPAVQLAPRKPGRFKLVDSMRLFNVAELFVLPYATVDVTKTDGAFRIDGIPVGEVQLNALLPQTGATVNKKIKIEEGKVTELDLELSFDRAAWDKKPKPKPLDQLPAPKLAIPD